MIGIIAVINFLSAFTQAASGFGYAIFAMFLMPLFLPFRQCSVISAAVIVVIALQMTLSLRRHITIRKILIPMVFSIPFIGVGVWIIGQADESLLRKIMGIFLIILSAFFYYTEKGSLKIKNNIKNSMIVGGLTGLSTGMFNIVGPFLALYYYDNCDNNLEFKANLECSFLIAGLVSLCLNLYAVKFTGFLATNIIMSGATACLAGIIGLKIFKKLNRKGLRNVILVVLPIMGIIQILK